MSYKVAVILFFMAFGIKGFSQDTLKTNPFIINNFALIEIEKRGSQGSEITTLHFDDGKMADITGKIYGDNPDLPLAQKVLRCIKYMKENKYALVSSTASTIGVANFNYYSSYDYQYIFERKEK